MRKIVGAVAWVMLPLAIIMVAWEVAKDWVESKVILDK